MLHLTKVAVGCATVDELAARMAERAAREGTAAALTRYRPTRHVDLVGGSLFWIIRHTLVVRQAITGFALVETDGGSRWRIGLAAPVEVVATPRRGHQGWRYLTDAPRDLPARNGDLGAMPPTMVRELAALWLV